MRTNYVQAGACVAPNDEFNIKCALESSQCPDGHAYFSSRQLQQHSVLNSKAKQCLEPDTTELVRVGRCTDLQIDGFVCTSHSSGCARSDEFNPFDNMCTLSEDWMQYQYTFFPKCLFEQDLNVCVWDVEECIGGPLLYNSVHLASFQLCKCEEVKTGACYHEETDTYTCAVSALGCDSESTYVRLQELSFSNAIQSMDCQLCRNLSTSPTGPPTPVPAPTVPPTAFVTTSSPPPTDALVPTFPPVAFSDRRPTSSSMVRDSLEAGELAVAIVAPTLILALVLACCFGRYQKKATFSSTAIEMEENHELPHGEEDHQRNEIQQNEILEESEFQLDGGREIT